jgi:hypothetical protein
MSTESVKINSQIVDRIRKQVKTSGQTISGFINLHLDRQLCQIELADKLFSKTKKVIKKN